VSDRGPISVAVRGGHLGDAINKRGCSPCGTLPPFNVAALLPYRVHDLWAGAQARVRKALGKVAAGAGPVAIVREVFDPR
jgi:hypothetical protein